MAVSLGYLNLLRMSLTRHVVAETAEPSLGTVGNAKKEKAPIVKTCTPEHTNGAQPKCPIDAATRPIIASVKTSSVQLLRGLCGRLLRSRNRIVSNFKHSIV